MYESFYQLTGKPFQLSPDFRFFFNSGAHSRAMAYLKYGLEQGEGFIVITGGIGTGKSMLISNLFSELREQTEIVAAQLVSTQMNEDELLHAVCAEFGVVHHGLGKAALLRNLEIFLRAKNAEGKRVLLVVDEAQNLPRRTIEELRMLSNYQQSGKALLQSFLLGQAELKGVLQGPGMEQVRQRIIAGHHLRPLDRNELQEYIEHRLHQVGWKGNPLITANAYDGVFEATGGVPRRINTMVDRLLLFGAIEELSTLDREHAVTVAEEMANEVGHSTALVQTNDGQPQSQPEAAPEGDDVLSRLQALEAQVANLKEQMKRDRLRVKKAILLQMDMDDEG